MLAAQWEAQLARERHASARVWPTPALVGMSRWLIDLWNEVTWAGRAAGAPEPPAADLLTPLQSATLWREIVRESVHGRALISPAAAARLASRAWERLCHWSIDPASLGAAADQPEFAAFLAWAREYRTRLGDAGWTDRAAMLEALGSGVARLEARPVRMLDARQFTPAEHRVVEGLRANGSDVQETRWSQRAPLLATNSRSGARALELADPADELRAAAAWIWSGLERDPEARLALVVPDLDRRFGEVDSVLEEIPAEAIAGLWLEQTTPLAAAPAIGVALDVLELLDGSGTLVQLSRWLRSTFFGPETPGERSACALLEAQLRQDLRVELPFVEAYRGGLAGLIRAEIPHRAAGLDRAVMGVTSHGSARTPTDWVNVWQRALIDLGWLRDSASAPQDTREAWEVALAELAQLTPIVGTVPARRAREELRAILERRHGVGRTPLAGVSVVARIDSVGPGYDGVWVTGFTDRCWPEPPLVNPLLPRRLQVARGMPNSTPALALASAETAFAELLCSSPEIVLSWPAVIQDQPMQPSSLLRSIARVAPAAALRSRPPARRARLEAGADPAPALTGTAVAGGVRVLDLQAVCPIRAFCETRLGATALTPLAPGLSPRLQGKIVHRALSLLIDSARAGGRFDAGELRTRVPAVVQRALAETFGAAREALATLFSLEQGRVERLLDAFLTRESGRLPFVPRAVESPIEIAIGQWSLSGRIDRVDALADDRIAVLDYKTAPGFQPSQWFQPRLVDTQLPLYAVALAAGGARLGALVVIELDADTIDYKGVGEGIVSRFRRLPDGRGWDDQVDEWRAALLTLLAEYARGDVRVFARDPRLAQGAYAPLTRVYEQLGDAEGGPDT